MTLFQPFLSMWRFVKHRISIWLRMRKTKTLVDDHHIARYLKFKAIDSGVINLSGFQLRRDRDEKLKEEELSVNWLEFYSTKATPAENIAQVQSLFLNKGNFTPKSSARFVSLNIGDMCKAVHEGMREHHQQVNLIAKHTPVIDEHAPANNDPSHSSVYGLPYDPETEALAARIMASYAQSQQIYPAIAE